MKKEKTYLKTNNNKLFDVDMAQSNIQIDLNGAIKTEIPSLISFNEILDAKLEFKHDCLSYSTGNIFVEYYKKFKYIDIQEDSGIKSSIAEFYIFDFDDITYIIKREMLMFILNNQNLFKKYNIIYDADTDNEYNKKENNIAYGMLIPLDKLFSIQVDYRKIKQEERLKNIQKNIGKNNK